MVKIPKREEMLNSTAYLLNNTLAPPGRRSRRLGISGLGGKCTRAMWFKFRWAGNPSFSIRVKRIFNFGHACEELVASDLRAVGITVTDEQKFVEGWGGHIVGYIDGIATGLPEAPKTPHLWENKSINERGFNQVKKHGVRQAKPDHYAQMQGYMGKLELDRALYTLMNKNTSEIYVERVRFNNIYYKEMMGRGVDVISAETTPPNHFNETSFECRFCDFKPICYEGEPRNKNCRTCQFVDIEDDGGWSCRKGNNDQVRPCINDSEVASAIANGEGGDCDDDGNPKYLSYKKQEIGCQQFRPLP